MKTKRWISFCLAAVLLLGILPVSPAAGEAGGPAAQEAVVPAEIMRFSAAEKTFSITNTAASRRALSTDWQYADTASETAGVDLTAHDPANLRLQMRLTLSKEGTAQEDSVLFAGGQAQLRSLDREGEHNARWMLAGAGLRCGENTLSFSLADLEENRGHLDLSCINRFQLYIDSLNNYDGTFTMSLSDVRIVDISGQAPQGVTAQIAQPTPGLEPDEPILYNRNAAEWGADPTGEADSTAAIQTCLNAMGQTGGVVFLPAGRYRVEGTLCVPEGVTLRGEWRHPDEGGLGKGTILMAYAGRGQTDPEAGAFLSLQKGTSLQYLGIWYPEQDPADIQPYPAAIAGQGHNYIHNITLYNAYTGLYDHHCSSLMVRGLYGTVLSTGIDAAEGYDIPRIEEVSFDTAYWTGSGLPGAPEGLAADQLVSYAREHVTGIRTGRQDGGYWYDLSVFNARYGCYIENGGIYIGALKTRGVQYGVYVTGISYPGLELTYSDIEAGVAGLYYAVPERETAVVSATVFTGGDTAVYGAGNGAYGINLNDCTFAGWGEQAVLMNGGNLTLSGCVFEKEGEAVVLKEGVRQAVLTGNRFPQPDSAVQAAGENTLLVRDDNNTDVPPMPDYEHPPLSPCTAGSDRVILAADYGVIPGGQADSSAALQQALDAAAQTGGIVYLAGGIYRLDSGLTIPDGVELRGSFEGPHFGNSTMKGTQLYAYAGKGQTDGAPLLDLGEGAGVSGITVFYPEQGFSDQLTDARQVKAYPPTIRMNTGSFARNLALVNAYTGIDAMTNRCDGLVISDVSGMALFEGLSLGHGTTGGAVRNFHLNSSGWVQQSGYETAPGGEDATDEMTEQQAFEDYLTRTVTEFTLGDAQDVHFFSCFGIDIATDIRLIADPYTGGSFVGTTWGVVFDGSYNGIVGEDGCDAQLTMLGTMGIFNKQGGGYNVITRPGFTGKIRLMTAGELGGGSKLAWVEGGWVQMVQVFSSSAFNGVCRAGGRLDFVGSTIITQYGDDDGNTPDITYEAGARGVASGNLDCLELLNIRMQPGTDAVKRLNGWEHPGAGWVQPGDVNGNGYVTSEDALLALQAATGKITLDSRGQAAADADGQNGITSADALLILQVATGKLDSI